MLQVPQPPKDTRPSLPFLLSQQRPGRVKFNNPPLLQHQDLIKIDDGLQPMRHGHYRPLLELCADQLADKGLCRAVEAEIYRRQFPLC